MGKTKKKEFAFIPEECLARLPEIPFDPRATEGEEGLRRAELRQSVRAIAHLDHVSEAEMVRRAVKNALEELREAQDE